MYTQEEIDFLTRIYEEMAEMFKDSRLGDLTIGFPTPPRIE